ncbi:glutathione S-transferase 1-like [Photinus pyralis]|uniref:Uncharacterized protein n=1 Tax=Photinus pyralis TaxID=7054 RepID=A0A1Y1M8E7_PHOPY|nr:glutathione S-transferase 1-like [Photinus pyralis]XP_031327733.1 glutathione S-transferase 1-like [Photinus pyralis]XP_031348259.1 glutathione S-transferase 1-like [Photinus pyralis]
MVLTLYHFPPSAPSRGALLAAHAVGVNVDVQVLNLFKKEQLKSDFVKINPQHTVPTLVDGEFVVWESSAIAAYLVNQYGKDDTLYPKDLMKKALVDQRLQFNCTMLYPRVRAICFPILYQDEIEMHDEQKAPVDEALGFLDVYLDGNDFVCGDKLTIADCLLVASVATIAAIGWDLTSYANVYSWVSRCALEIPNYVEVNQKGADEFGKAVKTKMESG